MKKITRNWTLLSLTLLALSAPAFAADPAPATPEAAPTPAGQGKLYLGLLAGAATVKSTLANSSTYTQFDYGGRIGYDAFQLGDFGKLGFGIHFDNISFTDKTTNTGASYGSVLIQILFHNVCNTGVYFAPEIGLGIFSNDIGITDVLAAGGMVGYEYRFAHDFAVGPEFHYTHFGSGTITGINQPAANSFKLLAGITYFY